MTTNIKHITYLKIFKICRLYYNIENKEQRRQLLKIIFDYYRSTTNKNVLTQYEYNIKIKLVQLLEKSFTNFVKCNTEEPSDIPLIIDKLSIKFSSNDLLQNIIKYNNFDVAWTTLINTFTRDLCNNEFLCETLCNDRTIQHPEVQFINLILECFTHYLEKYEKILSKGKINILDL